MDIENNSSYIKMSVAKIKERIDSAKSEYDDNLIKFKEISWKYHWEKNNERRKACVFRRWNRTQYTLEEYKEKSLERYNDCKKDAWFLSSKFPQIVDEYGPYHKHKIEKEYKKFERLCRNSEDGTIYVSHHDIKMLEWYESAVKIGKWGFNRFDYSYLI